MSRKPGLHLDLVAEDGAKVRPGMLCIPSLEAFARAGTEPFAFVIVPDGKQVPCDRLQLLQKAFEHKLNIFRDASGSGMIILYHGSNMQDFERALRRHLSLKPMVFRMNPEKLGRAYAEAAGHIRAS